MTTGTLRLKTLSNINGGTFSVDACERGSNVVTEVITVTELSDNLTTYEGDFTSIPAGDYELNLHVGSQYFAIDDVEIGSTNGATYPASSALNESVTVVESVAIEGDKLTLYRGDSISFPLTGLGSLVGRTKLWFTGKSAIDATDSSGLDDDEADVQIEETDGLVVINGADPDVDQSASITVDDAVAGDITIELNAAASKALQVFRRGYYDVQVRIAGVVTTLVSGRLDVRADVTKAVS